jgi:hypothetical protein
MVGAMKKIEWLSNHGLMYYTNEQYIRRVNNMESSKLCYLLINKLNFSLLAKPKASRKEYTLISFDTHCSLMCRQSGNCLINEFIQLLFFLVDECCKAMVFLGVRIDPVRKKGLLL